MSKADTRKDLPVIVLHNLDYSWEASDLQTAQHEVATLEQAIKEHGHPVENVAVCDTDLTGRLQGYDPEQHIVLNWCESLPRLARSEALIPRTLESLGFTYTGSPPDVLLSSWDKENVKNVLEQHTLPTPRWQIFSEPAREDWTRFPAIVKPAREHCSYGVTSDAVVLSPAELQERVAYVVDTFSQPALVEDFIDGREFHVSLWGNGTIEMLPPAEMDFTAFSRQQDRLCTFDSKFNPGSKHYDQIDILLPAPLSSAETAALEKTVTAAYRALGCRDYARLDIRLRDGVFYVLDINPNPDISFETSMVSAAELAGYSYGAMLSRLVNLAALRHPVLSPPSS